MSGRRAAGAAVLGGVAALVAAAPALGPWRGRGDAGETGPLATVIREDLDVTLLVAGDIASAAQTIVECELERIGGADGATILSVIDDGATVKKGDVLCRLDASSYEDLVDDQLIEIERSTAEEVQAELNLAAAELALREFRDGQAVQQSKEMSGQIALAESELVRARDRLAWSRRMLPKGYVAAAQVSADTEAVRRAELNLTRARATFEVFRRFTVPRAVRELESQIEGQRAMLDFNTLRLTLQKERLETLKKQVERCTIRAPHDGFVVHINTAFGIPEWKVREGNTVYQHQPLFLLPDLKRLTVTVSLHESIAARVKVGMRATIRCPALPGQVFEGRVTYLPQLPVEDWRALIQKIHFVGIVTFDRPPSRGLMPDMSAEVAIHTERRPGALVVPPEAVAVEDDGEYCYVAGPDVPERRPVRTRRGGRDRLEVTEGLEEGERVLLDPARLVGRHGRSIGGLGVTSG